MTNVCVKILRPRVVARLIRPQVVVRTTGGPRLPGGGNDGDLYIKGTGWVSPANFLKSYFDSLDAFTTDEAAVVGLLETGDMYFVADGSDSNIPGNLRRVQPI